MFTFENTIGQKEQFELVLGGADYRIPVTLINGQYPGKTILLTAQIHSGEYPGTPALIRIAQELEPAEVHGQLIIMPLVNMSGFYARSHAVLPEDGINLNQVYPGNSAGSQGEQIAHFFVSEIFPHVDFIIDLHSGDVTETLTPCLFYAKHMEKEILPIVSCLNIPYLIPSTATKGHYSWASHHLNIPGILLERGHSGKLKEKWVDQDKQDVYKMLIALQILNRKNGSVQKKQWISRKTIYLESDHTGLWYPKIKAGQFVKKGQILGQVEDCFGRLLGMYRAQEDGVVFYFTHCLAIQKGEPLVAYGLVQYLEKTKKHG